MHKLFAVDEVFSEGWDIDQSHLIGVLERKERIKHTQSYIPFYFFAWVIGT